MNLPTSHFTIISMWSRKAAFVANPVPAQFLDVAHSP